MFEGFLLQCFTCDLKLGPKNMRNSPLRGHYIPMKHDSGQGYTVYTPFTCAETDEEQLSHNRWTPMRNLTWIIRGIFQIIFMAWSQNHRCVFWAFSLCCSCYQRHSGSIFMWSNNVSVEERPETAKRALESAGLDHEVWNLIFMSFAILFFKPQWSTLPKLFADSMVNSSGAKTSIAGDLLAEYRKQSIQLGPVSGSLHWDTFFCVLFFGGALVWHWLKDILEDFCHDCEVIPFS